MKSMMMKRIYTFMLALVLIISSISMPPIIVNAEAAPEASDNYGEEFAVKVKSVLNGKYLQLSELSQESADIVTFSAEPEAAGTDLNMAYHTFNEAPSVSFTVNGLYIGESNGLGTAGPGGGIYTVAQIGGWESVRMESQGDGTIALKSNRTPENYLCVNDAGQLVVSAAEVPGTAEKFIIETDAVPKAVDGTGITFTNTTDVSVTVSWDALPIDCVFTGYEVYRAVADDKDLGSEGYSAALDGDNSENADSETDVSENAVSGNDALEDTVSEDADSGNADLQRFSLGGAVDLEGYEKVCDETTATSFNDTGLEKGTTYKYYVKTVNGTSPANISKAVTMTTLADTPPGEVVLSIVEEDGALKLTWNEADSASKYNVFRASSKYGDFKEIENGIEETTYTDDLSDSGISKYSYYKIQPENEASVGKFSEPVSLETELFGDNIVIFDEEDSRDDINDTLDSFFKVQRNAEFSDYRYAAYFKPGDYTDIKTIQVGYYTHIGGLGKTPYEVEISNVETPADERFKPGGYHGDWDNYGKVNATCTFWRSAENFTVVGTSGQRTGDSFWERWDGEDFNWGVSQAAPLRRINALKNTQLQWNYGQASGGFIADSLFATTPQQGSQQQYYQRNSEIADASVYLENGEKDENPNADAGWNAVYQGMKADFAPSIASSNWSEKRDVTEQGLYNQWGNVTIIDDTPAIREKPFLYFDQDADEYKVFVPTLRENSTGKSWSESSMGAGKSVSIKDFYVVKEDVDTSASINAALDEGKHLFFTPGFYYLDAPIHVKNADTIVLGTGYATLTPTLKNPKGAILVDDKEGITIAGFLLDAHNSSDYLIKVGNKDVHQDHSHNPILLADLFFRVGGFIDHNVHVDAALEVNSDDVIGDHFWIWRADHGAGVGWYRNTSPNGVIVNGDDVTFYGLMVEHFQEYQVLWNGENGKTFFLQNETPYDAPVQEAYMSHGGTVNGYSIYKVANNVERHYATGLGMYDVFINNYKDQTKQHGIEVGGEKSAITIANAIEVPHKPDVVVENACVVCISDDDRAPHGIENIINGVAAGTSMLDIGQRQQIVQFVNGIATIVEGEVADDAKQFDDVPAVVKTELEKIYNNLKNVTNQGNDLDAWEYFEIILNEAKEALENDDVSQSKVDRTVRELTEAYEALSIVVNKAQLQAAYNQYKNAQNNGYTKASWDEFQKQLTNAKNILDTTDLFQSEVDAARAALETAYKALLKDEPETPKAVKAAKVSLDKTEIDKMFIGDKVKLTATVTPANTTDKTVKYTSSNEKTAVVSSTGEVTAKGAGTAKITVSTTDGSNKTSTCTVTVYAKANKLTVTAVGSATNQKVTKLYVARGKKITLKSQVTPKGTLSGVKYTTANSKIATVSNKGVIKGKKAGKTKITVTSADGFKKRIINVTVTKKQTKVKSLKLTSKKSLKMKKRRYSRSRLR